MSKNFLKRSNCFELTEDGYFPNRDKECFISSLANLVYYKFKDFKSAKDIFINSKEHPLVGDRGKIEMLCAPLILEELSERKYSGLLYFKPHKTIGSIFFDKNGVSSELIKKAYNYSFENKLFCYDIKMDNPCIFLLENERSQHALVSTRNYLISDGHKKDKSLLFNNKLIGIFRIKKRE
jgi:hypothetical protein